MVADMATDMEVHMVAEKVADIVANVFANMVTKLGVPNLARRKRVTNLVTMSANISVTMS